jgi:hypothetical protein
MIELARRVVLHSGERAALRAKYQDACQVCGRVTRLGGDETYAEVHALDPPGAEEPDEAPMTRCVVLCPDHHALFDLGVMAIDPDDLKLHCADRRDRFEGRPLAARLHELSTEALRAAWKVRVEPPTSDDGAPRLQEIPAFVEFLLAAAVDEDEEAGFERYLSVIPGGRELASAGREAHRKFAWAQLRRRAEAYLDGRDPKTFQIVSVQPSEITPQTPKVRVMLAGRGRNPAPLAIERRADGNLWLAFMGL